MLANRYLLNSDIYEDCQQRFLNKEIEINDNYAKRYKCKIHNKLKSKRNSAKRYKCKVHKLTPNFLNFMLANKYLLNINLYNDWQQRFLK